MSDEDVIDLNTRRPPDPVVEAQSAALKETLRLMEWATHSYVVRVDIPELELRQGDMLHFDDRPERILRWSLIRQTNLSRETLLAATQSGAIEPLMPGLLPRGP